MADGAFAAAAALRARGRIVEAEALLRHALAMREDSFGPDHPETAKAMNNLGVRPSNTILLDGGIEA